MNTKQKLTLGIAAIFMVTLTIIGVTYAYFVTRVNYTGTETTAVIQTADIGSSINITAPVVLENAIPGQTAYKAFAVSTASASGVPFSIMITTSLNPDVSKLPEGQELASWKPEMKHKLPEFVHTNLTDTDTFPLTGIYPSVGKLTGTCYMSIDAAKAYTTISDENTVRNDCYNGSRYNNIELTLYRVHSDSGHAHYPNLVNDPEKDNDPYDVYGLFYEKLGLSTAATALSDFPQTNFESDEVHSGDVYKLKVSGETDKYVYADIVPVDPSDEDSPLEKNVLAPYNASYVSSGNGIIMGGSQIVPTKFDTPANNSYNLYVLKVHYKDIKLNQNIENDASVNIKIDITGNAEVTN